MLSALGSRLSALGSRLSALGSRRIVVVSVGVRLPVCFNARVRQQTNVSRNPQFGCQWPAGAMTQGPIAGLRALERGAQRRDAGLSDWARTNPGAVRDAGGSLRDRVTDRLSRCDPVRCRPHSGGSHRRLPWLGRGVVAGPVQLVRQCTFQTTSRAPSSSLLAGK